MENAPCVLTAAGRRLADAPLEDRRTFAAAIGAALAIALQTLEVLNLPAPAGAAEARKLHDDAHARALKWRDAVDASNDGSPLAKTGPRRVSHEFSVALVYEAVAELYELLTELNDANPGEACERTRLWAAHRLAQGLAGLDLYERARRRFAVRLTSGPEHDPRRAVVVLDAGTLLEAADKLARTFEGLRLPSEDTYLVHKIELAPDEHLLYPEDLEPWSEAIFDNEEPAALIRFVPPSAQALAEEVEEARIVVTPNGRVSLQLHTEEPSGELRLWYGETFDPHALVDRPTEEAANR